jgi:hypothetical protein
MTISNQPDGAVSNQLLIFPRPMPPMARTVAAAKPRGPRMAIAMSKVAASVSFGRLRKRFELCPSKLWNSALE